MRWQADTGQPAEMIGGYFTGPGPGGQAYIGGGGITPTALFLNALWTGHLPADPPSQAQVRTQLSQWGPAAVIAVTGARSRLGQYLIRLLGDPAIRSGNVLAWRTAPQVTESLLVRTYRCSPACGPPRGAPPRSELPQK